MSAKLHSLAMRLFWSATLTCNAAELEHALLGTDCIAYAALAWLAFLPALAFWRATNSTGWLP